MQHSFKNSQTYNETELFSKINLEYSKHEFNHALMYEKVWATKQRVTL